MSDSKKQSIIVIGIAMLIIAAVMLFFALNQPKMTLEEYNSSKAESSSSSGIYNTVDSKEAEQTTKSRQAATAVSFPINLNTCTIEELMLIDGIGEAKASAIIEYRSYIGGYTSVEQIKNISGIGDSVYEQISPYLCV